MQTQFEFTLPKGYVSADGRLHRNGTMRLATARDEIEPLRDRTIDGPDDPYLTILVLARVVTELGSLSTVDVEVVEGLFAADLAFLQDLYGIINFGDQADVQALQASVLDTAGTEPVGDGGEILEPDMVDDVDESEGTDGVAEGLEAMEAIVERDDVDDNEHVVDEEPTPSPRPRRARVEEIVSSARE